MAEGLLPAVKVFLDWLRTNPDLIIVCAQVCLPGRLRSRALGEGVRTRPRSPTRWSGKNCCQAPLLWGALILSTGEGLGLTFALENRLCGWESERAAYSALSLQCQRWCLPLGFMLMRGCCQSLGKGEHLNRDGEMGMVGVPDKGRATA